MPIVLLLEGAHQDQVQLRLSPLAELCASLHALADPDHHPASAQWAASFRAEAPVELISGCEDWSPLYGALRAQYFYPSTGGPQPDLEQELAGIATLSATDFVEMTAAAILGRRREFTPAGLLREGWAQRQFLESARLCSLHRHALAERLVREPDAFREQLLAFLESFAADAFHGEWVRRLPLLRAELHARGKDVGDAGFGALTRLAPGIAEHRNPHRLVFDKLYQAVVRLDGRPVLLMPSLFGAPHLIVKHHPGLPVTIQFPVARKAKTPAFPQVQQRLSALTDANRMAVVRAVAREPCTTADIAANTGMTEPQVSRHLRRLREAGLVRRERAGRLVFYALETDVLGRLGMDLLDTLRR